MNLLYKQSLLETCKKEHGTLSSLWRKYNEETHKKNYHLPRAMIKTSSEKCKETDPENIYYWAIFQE